jgi:phospholipase/carboxylesterase
VAGTRHDEPRGYEAGRLTARPAEPSGTSPGPGEYLPEPGSGWAGVLFVPDTVSRDVPAPLMVALHGATGRGARMLERWRDTARAAGLIVLAPDSQSTTWDVLRGGYGPDVEALDRALAYAFDRVQVDPSRLLIEGFSDGASYGLSLGLANGDLFTHVLANSPGFCMPPAFMGQPRLLLTHGTEDQILPIYATSRMLAPQLERAGYAVTYHEFQGGHSLTPEIMHLSLDWALLSLSPSPGPQGHTPR